MKSANDFWLNLARMADSYGQGGLTHSERIATAMQQFDHMPPVVQREVLAALRSAAYQLPDLYSIAAARVES